MKNSFVDLHIHSSYSDGTMSPREIVETAKAKGVGLFTIADHDLIEGNLELRELCRENDLAYIPAVEIDTIDRGCNVHILAYGFDTENAEFRNFLRHTRFALDESSVKLVEIMQKDYPEISLSEFMEYTYNPQKGGWKTLHYFMKKGITSSLWESVRLYPKYGITCESCGYSSIAATVHRIHKAGGYAVFAHPGDLFDEADLAYFRTEVESIVKLGLDGIECYYPSHSEEVTETCLDICRKHDLMITTGSDCHGDFVGSSGEIGCMQITIEKLVLKDLI